MEIRAALLAGILFFVSMSAFGEPTHRASVGSVVITLHTEKCSLGEVSNLERRATWLQDGKTFEGCFGFVLPFRMLMFYFKEDKTVAIVPAGMFEKVTGI